MVSEVSERVISATNIADGSVQVAAPGDHPPIKSIAVCAGSGASVFKGVEADLLLTGEMSHVSVFAMRSLILQMGQSLMFSTKCWLQ